MVRQTPSKTPRNRNSDDVVDIAEEWSGWNERLQDPNRPRDVAWHKLCDRFNSGERSADLLKAL